MANRFGNQYRIAIGTETSYGSGFTKMSGTPGVGSVGWTDLLVHSGVMVQTPVVNTATTTHKSLTHIDTPCEIIPTTKMGNVTVSGDATFDILKKYLSGVTKKVLLGYNHFFADPDDAPSFILLQLWSDAPTGTNFTVDRAIGAKLLSLEITGTSGGLIQFNANFETQPVEREATQAITGTDPGLICGTPLQFGDVIASLALGNDAMALESFTINLVNEYTADGTKFANSQVISNPRIIRQGGELSYTCNYDSTGGENDVDIINNQGSILSDSIYLTPDGTYGGEYIAFAINSIATSIERPDTDKDYFKLNYSGRIVYDSGTGYAVDIDLSNLT